VQARKLGLVIEFIKVDSRMNFRLQFKRTIPTGWCEEYSSCSRNGSSLANWQISLLWVIFSLRSWSCMWPQY